MGHCLQSPSDCQSVSVNLTEENKSGELNPFTALVAGAGHNMLHLINTFIAGFSQQLAVSAAGDREDLFLSSLRWPWL